MRRTAAILFLAIMVLNGALELAMAVGSRGADVVTAPKAGPMTAAKPAKGCCAASADADDAAEVAPPATTVVCTCKCCGPVCRMGADCRCGAPKVRVTVGGPMFFTAPSCHPENAPDPITGTYMPGSLQFRFLTATQPMLESAPTVARIPETPRQPVVERPDAPPVPPPKPSGSARTTAVSIA